MGKVLTSKVTTLLPALVIRQKGFRTLSHGTLIHYTYFILQVAEDLSQKRSYVTKVVRLYPLADIFLNHF